MILSVGGGLNSHSRSPVIFPPLSPDQLTSVSGRDGKWGQRVSGPICRRVVRARRDVYVQGTHRREHGKGNAQAQRIFCSYFLLLYVDVGYVLLPQMVKLY